MRVVTDSTVSICWSVGSAGGVGLKLSIAVKAGFLLKNDGVMVRLPEPPESSGDQNFDGEIGPPALKYASDFALFKPRADILLVGTAYAPGGQPVPHLDAVLRVGKFKKSIFAVGDRCWESRFLQTSIPSAPTPFKTMPIVYERAFGGPKFKKNPVGCGYDKQRLPNIESQTQPIRRTGDQPPPASFGPVSPDWEPRCSKVGTYRGNWLKERWPWFPDDFDWGYFNAAPEDQQVEGYLRGDEDLELVNLHPKHSTYRSGLPGLRARAFVQVLLPDGQLEFREVKLNLDTLWIDSDGEKAVLVWRGLTPIRSVKFKEVTHIAALTESMTAPVRTNEQMRLWMLAQEAIDKGEGPPTPEQAAAEAEAKAGWLSFDKKMAAMDAPPAALEKEFASMEEAAEKEVSEHKALLVADGVDPKLLEPGKAMTIPEMQADLRSEAAFIAELDPVAARKLEGLANDLGELQQVEQEFAALGPSATPLPSSAGAHPSLPPATSPAVAEPLSPKAADATVPSAKPPGGAATAAGKPGKEVDSGQGKSLAGADLSRVDLSKRNFSGADLSGTNFSSANLSGAKLVGTRLVGADFSEANLTGADFSNAILDEARFSEAKLEGAKFSGASVQRASLDDLQLSGVDFAGCHGKFPNFSGSNLEKANFAGAKLPQALFTRAKVNGASFVGAELASADFGGVSAVGINMQKADLTNLRAGEKSNFTGGKFREVKAPKSIWEGARLDQADFSQAVLTRAMFEDASVKEANFDRADLTKANFEDALAHGAQLTRANLLRASFNRTNLTKASLNGSNLYEASFWETVFGNTTVEGANTRSTSLG